MEYPSKLVNTNGGDQDPKTPLFEVLGKEKESDPEQISFKILKDGVIIGFTLIVVVAVVAHWLVAGVNVYVV